MLGTLALPKLNLQFLTVHDYLLRNFHLFRLESTCTFFVRFDCSLFNFVRFYSVNLVVEYLLRRLIDVIKLFFGVNDEV